MIQLNSLEKFVEHLQSTADDYKAERDTSRCDVSELSRKLQERNESIIKIEDEVCIFIACTPLNFADLTFALGGQSQGLFQIQGAEVVS